MQGFARGVPDTLIAKMLTGLSHIQVYNFRRSQDIASQTVLRNRYDTWIRMINSGVSLDVIADIYQVKPRSIQVVLWRTRGFSFVGAKKAAQKAIDAQFLKGAKKSRKDAFDW